MKGYKSQHVRSKWKVHQLLSKNPKLVDHLPKTTWLSLSGLRNMLGEFDVLYVKPNIGTHGKGIVRVEKVSDGQILVRDGFLQKYFQQDQAVYRMIRSKHALKKEYIIQQGIQLGTVDERPFDLRMMYQRRPEGPWVCTGIFAKIGKPGLYVTNYFQGGKLTTMQRVLEGFGLNQEEAKQMEERLKQLGREVAATLYKSHKGMHEMGIDVAIDPQHQLWILEVNSRRPQFYPLKNFKDKSMYYKMLSFAKSYGRPNGY